MTESMGEKFLDALMDACVARFFEGTPGGQDSVTGVYTPPRMAPAHVITEQLLSNQQGVLVQRIVDKIDMDELATKIADRMADKLVDPNQDRYGGNWNMPDHVRRARTELKERVDAALVQLLASDLHAKMRAGEEA